MPCPLNAVKKSIKLILTRRKKNILIFIMAYIPFTVEIFAEIRPFLGAPFQILESWLLSKIAELAGIDSKMMTSIHVGPFS